jgi:chemotaxis protein MotB
MRDMQTPIALTAALALASGCVSRGKYDAAVTSARDEQTRSQQQLTAKNAELMKLRRDIDETEARLARTQSELGDARQNALACTKSLDDGTALNQQLRAELQRLGRDVDQLLSAKGVLASSLEQARARLEELRRAQAASEARASLFQDLALRLKRMVDAGELQIFLRSGRMVLALPADVLFDSGKSKLGARGRQALSDVGAVLGTLRGRRFQVAGHTDDEPIRFSGFVSNWELSTQRALEIVAFLVKTGMPPEALSAAGYAEFDPVSPNDTPEGKAKNRRIEITLQPNIDEFVYVPEPR